MPHIVDTDSEQSSTSQAHALALSTIGNIMQLDLKVRVCNLPYHHLPIHQGLALQCFHFLLVFGICKKICFLFALIFLATTVIYLFSLTYYHYMTSVQCDIPENERKKTTIFKVHYIKIEILTN